MNHTMKNNWITSLRFMSARFLATTAILVTLSVSLGRASQQGYATFPGEGSEWLKWTEQEKHLFVAAFVVGYTAGIDNSCVNLERVFVHKQKSIGPEKSPFTDCLKVNLHYSRPIAFYVDRITAFYTQNQKYYSVPAYILMRALPDEKEATLEDMKAVARSVNPL